MERVALPGGRDARAILDGDPDAETVVVACPPHPRHGGTRSDQRLRAVADALGERGIAALRFDYGPWDGGRGERRDAAAAVEWSADRFERVGLFGYSFGAAVALLVAADPDVPVGAVSALAPPATHDDGADVAGALADLTCPAQVVYGERDDAVAWRPVVERARGLRLRVDAVSADHHFVGQAPHVGTLVAEFLAGSLLDVA